MLLGLDVVDDDVAVGVRVFVDDLAAVESREAAAAAGAVVVGHHDDLLRRVKRHALEVQIDDTAALGLGHVNLIAQTCALDHVEVIGREAGVNQLLVFRLGRVDLVEILGGFFQPGLHVRALDLHRLQGVGVEVDVGHVLDGDAACGHVGEARVIEVHLERCSGRDDRQLGVLRQALAHHVRHVGELRVIHQLHHADRARLGELAGDTVIGGADRGLHVLDGRFVLGFNQLGDFWINRAVHLGAAGIRSGDRLELRA